MANVTTNWNNGAGTALIGTAGNWDGGLPTSDDRCYFLKMNDGQNPPQGTAAQMDDLTLIDADLVMVGEGYTKTIGGSGTPMEICADLVWYRGTSGKLWLKEGTAAGGTDLVLVDSTSSDPLSHDCIALDGATFVQVDVIRGMATLLTGCTITTLNVGLLGTSSQAKCVINAGTITVTTLNLYSGIITNSQALATVNLYGGIFTQALGVNTTTNIFGGRCNLNVAGTYTTIKVYPGATLDLSQDGSRKIVTNMYEYPGSTVIGRELLKVTNNMISV